MKFNNKRLSRLMIFSSLICLVLSACQKMDRPELVFIPDPPPPPYNPLKHLWEFEGNAGDSGDLGSTTELHDVTFAEGIKGQGAKIEPGGYALVPSVHDSIRSPNSITVSFWMNGVGPVVGGAQGLFSISNKNEFWGNFDIFLENNDNGAEAFLKLHMFNSAASDGKGEEWHDVKIPGALNKWSHIAVVYDAATSKLSVYADGQPTSLVDKVLGGGNYGLMRFKDVNGLVLGTFQFQTDPSRSTEAEAQTWAKSFNGVLDQVRVYNFALTASEINQLYTNQE